MSKIARYTGNLPAFASNAQGLERTVFGSTVQADDLTSQVTDAFLRGWGIVGPAENPSLEDFNAAFYTVSQLIAYQHQMGVPEWDGNQEYYAGSICSHEGEIYVSLSGSNTGNEPPSTQWTIAITAKNGISKLGLGTAAKKDVGIGANQIPDMSFFPSIKGTSGYAQFPNGMIEQWGFVAVPTSTSAANVTATLSVPFPNLVTSITATFGTADPSSRFVGINNTGSLSQIRMSYVTPTGNNIYWRALGY